MKCPNKEYPMSHKIYDTTERNAAQGTIKDCSCCSKRKQKKCHQSKLNKPYRGMTPIPQRKVERIKRNSVNRCDTKANLVAVTLNRRTGFMVEDTGKVVDGREKYKLTPVIYGRTVSMFDKRIHS